MKNTGNLVILLTIILSVAFACKTTDKIDSHFAGCVTANGEKIGIGFKRKVFVVDAKNGQILKTSEAEKKQGAVVCSQQNNVFAVYSDEVVNIETGEKYPRRIAGSTVIGVNSKNNLVGYEGSKIKKGSGKPLKILVEKPNDQTDDLKLFELSPEKLDAVKRNKSSFLTLPVKLLDNNELLVFAGGKTRTIPADEQAGLDPDIWGFYKVKLENGEITQTKAIDKAIESVNLFNLPNTDATANGKVAALSSMGNDGKVVFVFNTETGEEVFQKSFDEKIETGENSLELREISSIALSKDGSKLAVAGVWADFARGRSKKELRIFVYDLQEGNEIANFTVEGDKADLIGFDGKEMILSFDNKSIAKINAETGEELWKTQLVER